MSNARFSIIQARAVRDDRITPAQFRTLCALGIYGDEDGWCFPNLKTLGEDLGKSKQAVSKDIKALVTLGYVQTKRQYRADGSQRGNLYRLLFDDERGQRDDNGGKPPEVDGCQLNTVDGGQLPEVDALTSHINAPINDSSNIKPSIDQDNVKLEICKLFNYKNDSQFELGITTTQKMQIEPLLKMNPDKCYTIAKHYVNEGLYFKRTIGKIINLFDTWKDKSKKNDQPAHRSLISFDN